jgi:hypothetical protein
VLHEILLDQLCKAQSARGAPLLAPRALERANQRRARIGLGREAAALNPL